MDNLNTIQAKFLRFRLILKLLFLAFCCMQLTACGTIMTISEGNRQVYAGVRYDLGVIEDGGVLGVLAVVDLPLSFILDTLLLPVALN